LPKKQTLLSLSGVPGTGDLVLDMENQVKANTMRIQVLEQQNDGLQRSITKMMARHAAHVRDEFLPNPNQQN
jgi:hypothetical protein